MKIDRITFAQLYPTTSFLNVRLGAEMSINEGDSPIEGMQKLKQFTEEFYKNNFQQLPIIEDAQPPEPAILPIVNREPLSKEDEIRNEIKSVQELKVLESYQMIIGKKYPNLQTDFDNKLNELQNGCKVSG